MYDKARKKSVLVGGQATLTSFPADTWTWDGTRWESAPGTTPGARIHYGLVYDHAGQRTLMFGGHDPVQRVNKGDTWTWTGSGWTPAAESISPRTHAELGVTSSGVILMGGLNAASATLQFVSGVWRPATATGGPGARYLTAMAYDAKRNVTVLFGGGDPATDRLLDDTWELGATGWRKIR